MRSFVGALVALHLVAGTVCSIEAQEVLITPVYQETEAAAADASAGTLPAPSTLPSPLVGLGPQTSAEYQIPDAVEQSVAKAAASGSSAASTGALPAPAEVLNHLPLPDIAPSAIVPFANQERSARLVRGEEVVVLSNAALRNSGVFNLALQNSATLAQQYHALQTQSLRVQGLSFQVAQANAAGVAQADVDGLSSALNVELAAQAQAEAQFETDLWNYGLNGAKVGTISSSSQSTVYAAAEPARYVMVQAIGPERQNNLGYTRTVVYSTGELGATTVPSEYLLPLPVEANDLFYDKGAANYVQRAPDGWMIPLTADPTINPVLQTLVSPRGSIYHDTGFIASGQSNFAENVSLGSRNDPAAGQTFFTDAKAAETFPLFPELDVAMNAQAMDVGGGNSLQFFTVANNDLEDNVFNVSSLGARVYNRNIGSLFEGWSLVAGLKQSVFGELAMTPSGVNGNRSLLGTVNLRGNVSQFSIEAPFSDYLTAKVGIEDPRPVADVFFTTQAGVTQLHRYPTLASSLDFHDRARINRLQLGSLLRSNGYEINATNQEFFATGWGLSAIAQFQRGNATNFMGVVGGEGIGQYMEGIQYSVVSDPTIGSIESIEGYGAYAGRAHYFYDSCNRMVAVINAAYGYSLQENPDVAGPAPNRKLHQAWINYTRFFGDRLAVGLEYQYGYREVVTSDVGEDHRAMMVISLRSAPTKQATQVQSSDYAPTVAYAPVTGKGGLDADKPMSAADVPAVQMQAVPATIDGRPINDVVNQYQLGGAAFQQGL